MFNLKPSPADPSPFEREAHRIADPLERLRYLRKHVPASVVLPEPEVSPAELFVPAKPKLWRFALAGLAIVAIVGGGYAWLGQRPAEKPAPVVHAIPAPGPTPNHIWQVQLTQTEEVYSNGLRIDLSFATRNRPRAEYPIYAMESAAPIGTGNTPLGIVYHTTESDMAPFEEDATKQLKTLGHLLLQYIRREHSYHYLIDRFGRVYRVVEESDAANHAGFSVWSDDRGVYVNLNDSFIGVAFEGSTNQREEITAAQVSAARALTELLREHYSIAAENCVTHAQVSVNPLNMKLSNHTDWAREFPFAALNLPDNYTRPIAAVEAFGFEHDEVLTGLSGGKDWAGLRISDQRLREAAASQGATEWRYRGMLRHRYQEIVAELKRQQAERDAAAAKGK